MGQSGRVSSPVRLSAGNSRQTVSQVRASGPRDEILGARLRQPLPNPEGVWPPPKSVTVSRFQILDGVVPPEEPYAVRIVAIPDSGLQIECFRSCVRQQAVKTRVACVLTTPSEPHLSCLGELDP